MNQLPSEEKRADLIRRAQALPRARSLGEVKRFVGLEGNNLYLLFIEMMRVRAGIKSVDGTTYLKAVQALGEPWAGFLSKNAALVEELIKLAEEYNVYLEIMGVYGNLIQSGLLLEADEFESQVNSFSGIDGISSALGLKLNPLLFRASFALRECGIHPGRFTLLSE